MGRVLGSSSLLRVDAATELLDFSFFLMTLTFKEQTTRLLLLSKTSHAVLTLVVNLPLRRQFSTFGACSLFMELSFPSLLECEVVMRILKSQRKAMPNIEESEFDELDFVFRVGKYRECIRCRHRMYSSEESIK